MKAVKTRLLKLAGFVFVLSVCGESFAQVKEAKKEEKKEEAKVLIEASVGYTGYYNVVKPGYWYPVWVTIKPQAFDLTGRLWIQQPEGELRVEAPVQIPKGVAQRFLLFFRFEERLTQELQVMLESRRLGRETFPLQLRWATPGEQHILVLAEKPGGFSFLNRQPVHDLTNPQQAVSFPPLLRASPLGTAGGIQPSNSTPAFGGTSVAYGDTVFLPDQSIALEALDAIIINTPAVRAISEEQWRALREWMAEGGRLLVAGGRYQPFIAQSLLKELYGLAPAAGEQVELPAFGGAATATTAGMLAVASLPGNPGDTVKLTAGSMPLLAAKRVGRGWFYYSAVAFDPPVLDWMNTMPDPQAFWLRLLERHWTATPLDRFRSESDAEITAELEQSFNFKLAGAGWFFRFVGLYILLVLPVNWFVCRKIGHREWTWPVAVMLALGFSAYGYSSGLSRQGKQLAATTLTAVRRLEEGDAARVKSWNGMYSPRRFAAAFDLPVAAFPYVPQTRPIEYMGDGENLFASRPLTVMFGRDATRIGDLFFFSWSTRRVAVDYMMPVEGHVEVVRPLTRDGLNAAPAGAVRNGTPWAFTYWMITDGNKAWSSDAVLAAGAEADTSKLFLADQELIPHLFQRLGSLGRGHAVGENLNTMYGYAESMARRFEVKQALGMDPRQRELFFVGIAQESESPVVAAMEVGSRIGLMVYEESLGTDEKTAATGGEPAWRVQVVRSEKFDDEQRGLELAPPDQILAAKSNHPAFQQSITDIRLVPDREIDTKTLGALAVSFKVESFPSADKTYHRSESYGGERGLPATWKVTGCPVSVFNWRAARWEEFASGRSLAPAAAYLEPATQAIQLRLFADPEHMLYEPTSGKPEEKQTRLGKDIWPTPWMQSEPHFFQLGELNVKLEPAEPANQGAQP